MKVKSELQGASPDIREIQLTLKRFIIDLDVKEAYEFSILNPFLINEEELNNLVADLNQEQISGHGFNTDNGNGLMMLDLHPPDMSGNDFDHRESSEDGSEDEDFASREQTAG